MEKMLNNSKSIDLSKEYKVLQIVVKIVIYGFLAGFGIIVLIPFYWMLVTALRSAGDLKLVTMPITPTSWVFKNFYSAFIYNHAPFAYLFRNTIIVAFFSTLGVLVTTILAAFAFSRLKFKGRELIFTLLLATMMIPGEMMIITNYITVAHFGWVNPNTSTNTQGFLALIVPFMTSVFYIFFLRQTFRQIPDELYYAAKVDGTSDFKYLMRVMIPIGSPTIITITILNALGSWNAYIWPNLVTNSDKMRLVTNGLQNAFNQDNGGTATNLQMAAATIVTIPILILFLVLRKQIMRGVSRSGIKG